VAICFEDRTIPELVKSGRVPADDRASQAAQELVWLSQNWFLDDHYVKVLGKPLLLSFGTSFLTDAEWASALEMAATPVAYVSQRQKRSAAIGGFDWPVPREGLAATKQFYRQAAGWPVMIPVAFPRFDDMYEQAHVHPSYGAIADLGGTTFRKTFEAALQSRSPIIQIATWNDWGEGTVIEPSTEFGTRDLEVIQSLRKQHLEPAFRHTKEDLKLPGRLLDVRRRAVGIDRQAELDAMVVEIANGALDTVRVKLAAER